MVKKKIIKQIIELNKPINTEKFIKLSLYDKQGYYKKDKIIGKQGDFITSPEISQLFGEIICFFIISIWKNKIKKNFNLVELGPGNGTLLIDILNISQKLLKFKKSFDIYLIENNPALIKNQRKNLKKFNYNIKNITWKNKLNIPLNKPNIIYANEFFDCLPIRQFFKKNKEWHEKMITFDKKEKYLKFIDVKVNNKKTLTSINKYKNNIIEISKMRDNYFMKICEYINISGGMIIIFDYGYFNKPNHFTLQSVFNNKKSKILDNIGCQDITSLVDFKNLINIAKFNRLNIDIFCTQREFLIEYGINTRAKKIKKNATKFQQNEIDKGLKRLIDENKMGSLFKVLVVSK